MNKIKNFLNKTIIPIITICVIIISVWLVSYTITGGKWYYRWQFNKNDTVSQLHWVYEDPSNGIRYAKSYDADDLEIIMNQMVDYLMNKEESMQVIDKEGMEVFSIQALKHMKEVRDIYNRLTIISIILIFVFALSIVYLVKQKNEVKPYIKKGLFITLGIIGGLLLIVCIGLIIDDDWTFTQFHHVLFPNINSFRDAFFSRISNYQSEEKYYINNLLLVTILQLNVFIDAAWIIVLFILICTGSWATIILLFANKNKKENIEIDIA